MAEAAKKNTFELLSELHQMEVEMQFVDPTDEETINLLQQQIDGLTASLLAKGEGLIKYHNFLKTKAKAIEAESKEYYEIYKALKARAEAIDNGRKSSLENVMRPIIEKQSPEDLTIRIEGRTCKVVRNPPRYITPEYNEVHGEVPTELAGFVVTPRPYIDYSAVISRMKDLTKMLKNDDMDKATELIYAAELKALSNHVEVEQGTRVQIY
jgi:hypothetical protein